MPKVINDSTTYLTTNYLEFLRQRTRRADDVLTDSSFTMMVLQINEEYLYKLRNGTCP